MPRRVAVVTGANRVNGIGYEIVRGLLKADMAVVLTSRDAAAGEAAAASFKDDRVTAAVLDVGDASSIAALAATVKRTLGGIDVLVNNAGVAFPIESKVPFGAQARQSIDTNYYGTKRMIEAFAPLLRPGARVVGVSSAAGKLSSSWSDDRRAALLAASSPADLDGVAEAFVAAAEKGEHRKRGFPGTAYGTSKTRVLRRPLHFLSCLMMRLPSAVGKPAVGRARFRRRVRSIDDFCEAPSIS